MKKNSRQELSDSTEESFTQQEGDDVFYSRSGEDKKNRSYKKRRIKPVHKNWEQ